MKISRHRHSVMGRALGLALAGWVGAAGAWSQSGAGERPVPRISFKPSAPGGASGPATEVDSLLPPLDPFAPAPTPAPAGVGVIPLPPDVPPLGLPSDGELAPSFPDLPDLPESSLIPQSPDHDDEASGLPGAAEDAEESADDSLRPPAARRPSSVSPPPPPLEDPSFPVWHESPKKARDLAQAENRCLLLVFSSSLGQAGGTSRQMSDEVLASPEFNEFALRHLVICGLFYTKSSSLDMQDPTKIARSDAMAAIKKAFKVRGFPCVILCGPDGREIKRWSGYVSGRGVQLQQQIRLAVEGHEAVLFASDRRRDMLAAKGYRNWTSAHGTTLFARLLEYDAHSAVLRDEHGTERTVRLKQLALPDRERITRQRLGKPMPDTSTPPPTVSSVLE